MIAEMAELSGAASRGDHFLSSLFLRLPDEGDLRGLRLLARNGFTRG
jgi:hypothetical protein